VGHFKETSIKSSGKHFRKCHQQGLALRTFFSTISLFHFTVEQWKFRTKAMRLAFLASWWIVFLQVYVIQNEPHFDIIRL
jgi:hypothetical protein